ncbi:serine/threonine protein kinase [Nonomuraea sp. NN258]|uniref:serine/threonine-protein kinase n=1 Tax=Nonomuraea antri TaxID=2730852 RepID=UPI001568AEDF|nr:serine/threonine-protein kinase [Nonomuraea antri]NRQ38708.1 serine/threonine protein kinase [Nonomuraea antri]
MVSDSNRLIAGRYQLLRELGRGGMGVVWEGRDTLLNRQVAIKEVLLPDGVPPEDRERQLLRTTREARTAAKLNHPSVVAIYDVVEEDGRPWIIMELVSTPSVEEVVARSGALPVWEAADVGRQVLSALRSAHEAGILHRDVKPSNVLLTEDGRAVLTDFGIATAEGDSSLTSTGMVTGSPSFLAPERVRDVDYGPASDLWSLGATLFASMVGRSPFERGDPMATLNALLNEEPDYRRIPPVMHPVLKGLLRKEPGERMDAAQADRLLTEVAASKPVHTDRLVPEKKDKKQRGGRRTLLAAAAAALVAIGAGGVAYLKSTPPAVGAAPTATARPDTASPAPSSAAPASAAPSATPTPTPTPTRTGIPVRSWNSPDGWTITRPARWRGAREEFYTHWTRRDGNAHLGVRAVYATTDPHQVLRDAEETLKQQAQDVVGVRRRTVVHQGVKAVEWEFAWTAAEPGDQPWATQGTRYREVRRALTIGDTAYVLSWTVAEPEWRRNVRLMRQVIDSFTVGT